MCHPGPSRELSPLLSSKHSGRGFSILSEILLSLQNKPDRIACWGSPRCILSLVINNKRDFIKHQEQLLYDLAQHIEYGYPLHSEESAFHAGKG